MKVLLTGGRAPATLELARLFNRAGWQVHIAESMRLHLSRYSKAVKKTHIVSSPRFEPSMFASQLIDIVKREEIDLLIPTCEEVFYVAAVYDQICQHCTVLTEPLERLKPLHNKFEFPRLASEVGVRVPETCLITSQPELEQYLNADFVLKPVYSRFGTQTVRRPQSAKDMGHITPSPESSWVAQHYLEGREICSHSVVHRGQITAHTAYEAVMRSGGSRAAVAFRHINHASVFEWVQKFVSAYNYTGQIGFDFIETASGDLYAIECNPRATSGVHLLAACDGSFIDALQGLEGCIMPAVGEPAMLGSAMLLYCLPALKTGEQRKRWWETFKSSRDVLFDHADPIPAVWQAVSMGAFAWLGLRHHINLTEATTWDIEWNGDLHA